MTLSIYVSDYLQVFSAPNVYKFDDKHRKQVADKKKGWLEIDPHLDRLYLHAKGTAKKQSPSQKQRFSGKKGGSNQEICKKFNSSGGCDLEGCKFGHFCSVKGCHSPRHNRTTHNDNVPPRFAIKDD